MMDSVTAAALCDEFMKIAENSAIGRLVNGIKGSPDPGTGNVPKQQDRRSDAVTIHGSLPNAETSAPSPEDI